MPASAVSAPAPSRAHVPRVHHAAAPPSCSAGESERFQKSLHNQQLLWHGSRTTNFAGILSQGLRIAPPEAPVTGYMFGKGVYTAGTQTPQKPQLGHARAHWRLSIFASASDVPARRHGVQERQLLLRVAFQPHGRRARAHERAQRAAHMTHGIPPLCPATLSTLRFGRTQGLLLLCQVALGNVSEKTNSDYNADKLQPGKHSTKGVGRTQPDPAETVTLPDGVVVPLGKATRTPRTDTVLEYNEYICYDITQIRLRYLLRVRFVYA